MSVVYFIASAEAQMIKIGFTSKGVEERFAALQRGSPVELEILAWGFGDRKHERAFHEKFAEHWSHGEWFRAVADVIADASDLGRGGDCNDVIDASRYTRGIFVAHIIAGVDSERLRRLRGDCIPDWVCGQ